MGLFLGLLSLERIELLWFIKSIDISADLRDQEE